MADFTIGAAKGFNPFLSETDYAPPPVEPTYSTEAQLSNPFLQSFAPEPVETQSSGGGENPFLSYSASSYDYGQETVASSNATNPFADFAIGESTSNAFSAFQDTVPSAVTNNGPFAMDWSTNVPAAQHEMQDLMSDSFMDSMPPDMLDIAGESPMQHPPPSVPQSTQDLLDTVTGALEATSDSLLHRLRVTQPSPVPLAPSPSPSPRSPSPDLLLGDDPPPPPPPSANPLQPSPHQLDSIIDLFDSSPQQSSGHKSSLEILGLYNNVSQAQPQRPSAPVIIPISEAQQKTAEVAEPKLFEPLQDSEKSPLTSATVSPQVSTPATVVSPESRINTEPTEESKLGEPMKPTFAEQPVKPQVPESPIKPKIPESPIKPKVPESPIKPKVPESPIKPKVPESPVKPKVPESPVRPKVPEQPLKPFVPEVPKDLPIAKVEPEITKTKKATPPGRPKPPPAPQRSPVVEARHPLPSRPPPPVPPAPRIPAQPHHPPPPVPPAPVVQTRPTPSPVQPFSAEPSYDPFGNSSAAFASPASIPAKDSTANQLFHDIFAPAPTSVTAASAAADAFDDFEAKFNSVTEGDALKDLSTSDPFGMPAVKVTANDSDESKSNIAAWGGSDTGASSGGFDDTSMGFGNEQGFDPFLSMTEPPPVPQSTPAKSLKSASNEDFDGDENNDLAIFIRPKSSTDNELGFALAPALAPPPKSPAISTGSAFSEETSAFVPFLSSAHDTTYAEAAQKTQMNRTDSQETPQTPLFEEDTSQPLEEFPRTTYIGDGWEMQMRHPNKKKITGQRFWKKVFVRLAVQNEVPVVQLFNNKTDKDPFQEIPLQPCYSVSDIGAQQFDNYGKIFTVKLQYVFYKERPGVRPGQITKAERITNKLSQFAAYAIQGDYQGVKEFGSDLKKLGLPVEHAPQISQLVKLGTQTFEELKQFSCAIEESLFKMTVHRDRAIQYKTEEVQVTLVDEYYVEQDIYGVVTKQIARVRLYFLSFLSGVAEVEMGINDLRRQGKEVVGRHDIIPIATEEWIRIEDIEFSNCVQLDEFENTKTIKFKPPDACYIELIRFRVRPPKHRELPLQIKAVFTTTGNRVEIRCDVLVPGFTSRKLGQIPCEDVMIRFPIPECWIYMFRVEKHFRYGSVKSAHRRSGKVKGIERFLGAVETVEQSLMEVTSGQAKYEHQHKSIVWRIARLPKDGQGAYTTHSFFCHITLQAHEEVPENLSKYCYVEFTMPHTTISHTVCRSISVPTSEEPPEKCVRYLSRHEYIIEIEHTQGITPATYSLAAAVPVKEEPEPPPPPEVKPETKDSDSDFSD